MTGVKGAIFVMAVAATAATIMAGATTVKGAITVKGATTAITATIATIVTAGAKGPLPTAGTMTGPQAGGSLTVRPVRPTVSARSAMTATDRAGGLRVPRATTDPVAMTVKTAKAVRIAKAARTGRTETAVAARGVTLAVGGMAGRAAILAVGQAGTETAVVRVGRADVLARAAASPNRPLPE